MSPAASRIFVQILSVVVTFRRNLASGGPQLIKYSLPAVIFLAKFLPEASTVWKKVRLGLNFYKKFRIRRSITGKIFASGSVFGEFFRLRRSSLMHELIIFCSILCLLGRHNIWTDPKYASATFSPSLLNAK